MKNFKFIFVGLLLFICNSAYCSSNTERDIQYEHIVDSVIVAINANDVYSVSSLFTADGFKMISDLTETTKVNVVDSVRCHFIEFGEDVLCFFIPLQLSPDSLNSFSRRMTLVFNNKGKISRIQFAIDRESSKDIMTDMLIPKEHRLAIINFMEIYQTAYSLRQMQYIDDLFSTNAVMLIGSKAQVEDENNPDLNQIAINSFYYRKHSIDEYLEKLQNGFESKGWIDVTLHDISISITDDMYLYGINFVTDFKSANFSAKSNLFFCLDITEATAPKIIFRVWQPSDDNVKPFDMSDYTKFMESSENF
ncbi:MAG: hypothetical protein MJ009_03935 [Paludibacteraceae bacterium]|nr:hypothetical protein [Paludibacteraceae bacterium]